MIARRCLVLAALAAVALGCGGASTHARRPTPSTEPTTLAWEAGPFSLTLADGVRLAMDGDATLLRDDVRIAALQPDGRLVDTSGHAIATLLPDGQVAYRGSLTDYRVHAGMPAVLEGTQQTLVRSDRADFVILEGETLRIVKGDGPRAPATVTFAPDASEHVRPLVVLVVLLELLEHPRQAEGAPTAIAR